MGPKGQGLESALFQMGSNTELREAAADGRPGAAPPVVPHVEDCRKTFEELRDRGVRLREHEPVVPAWGIAASLADPDGSHFSIAQSASHPSPPSPQSREGAFVDRAVLTAVAKLPPRRTLDQPPTLDRRGPDSPERSDRWPIIARLPGGSGEPVDLDERRVGTGSAPAVSDHAAIRGSS